MEDLSITPKQALDSEKSDDTSASDSQPKSTRCVHGSPSDRADFVGGEMSSSVDDVKPYVWCRLLARGVCYLVTSQVIFLYFYSVVFFQYEFQLALFCGTLHVASF